MILYLMTHSDHLGLEIARFVQNIMPKKTEFITVSGLAISKNIGIGL
jgi:hypothetical protein